MEEEDVPYEIVCDETETEPGVKIYYELHGKGPGKVMMVMGLGGAAVIWEPIVTYLSPKYPEYQFCIYDNRGVGRSSIPPGRYKTSVMAKDAIQLANHFGWDKFHLIAISMGGMISQEIALAIPHRICTLNLGSTHSGKTGSLPSFSGVRGLYRYLRAPTPEEKAFEMMKILYPESFLQEEVDGESNHVRLARQKYTSEAKLPPLNEQGFRSQMMAVNTHSIGAKRLQELKHSGIPILICTGDTDDLVDPKASYYLRDNLDPVEFIVWENTGHGLFFRRFNEYTEAIVRHLQRRSSEDMPPNLAHKFDRRNT